MKIRLSEKQQDALNKLRSLTFTEVLFDGGSRSGKTFVIIYFIIWMCLIFKGLRCLIARSIFSHAKSSLWTQTLLPMLDKYFYGHYKINKTDFIITFSNGSQIWLGGLDDKERTDKILGQEYGLIFLNEAVDIAKRTTEIVETRLAQNIKGFKNLIIYDCNPRSPAHWLYKKFYINKTFDQLQINWIPEDNIDNLPNGYIQRLEKQDYSSQQRFRYGRWCNVEGAVHKNIFDKNMIDVNKNWAYYDDITLGMDFGYYSTFNVWGHKGEKSYCLYDAVIIDGTTKDIIRKLDEIPDIKKRQWTIYADHELDRIQQIEDEGYYIKKAYKEVGAGDSSVNERELFFDKSCQNTFQCMLNIMRQQDKNGDYTEKHVKENDHEDDAARYGIHGYKVDNTGKEPVFTRGF